MCVKRVSSFPFPGNEMSLTSLQFPRSSFVPFQKTRVTLTFFQASGTSPSCHELSKTIKSGLSEQSSLSECFHELEAGRQHGYLQGKSLLPEYLMGQKPEDCLDVDCEVTPGSAGKGPSTGVLLVLGAFLHSLVDTTAWYIIYIGTVLGPKEADSPVEGDVERADVTVSKMAVRQSQNHTRTHRE